MISEIPVRKHLKPAIGSIRLQQPQPLDLEKYYTDDAHLSAATLRVYHAVISIALESATKAHLVSRNLAAHIAGRRVGPTKPSMRSKETAGAFIRRRVLLAAAKVAASLRRHSTAGCARANCAACHWADMISTRAPHGHVAAHHGGHQGGVLA